MKWYFLVTLCSIFLGVSQSHASDEEAGALYEQADQLYAQRGEGVQNTVSASALLDSAYEKAESSEMKFMILILNARSQYWSGQNTPIAMKDKRLGFFNNAMNRAKIAQHLSPDLAEGYYYFGIALGRWAETNGISSSLGRSAEMKKSIEDAMARKTFIETAGQTLDGYGPERTLGRWYFKVPLFWGGSSAESKKHLEIAYANGKDYILNYSYLAETLLYLDEKDRACSVLTEALALNPETLNPDRIPEAKQEYQEAQTVYNSNCK